MKSIKFNLNYGNKTVRSFDELKDNYIIDMLLEKFEDGMLVRWLEAQGLKDKVKKVRAIKTNSPEDTAREILKSLFDDEKEFSDHDAFEAKQFYMRKKETDEKEIIKRHLDGYKEICKHIDNCMVADLRFPVVYPVIKAMLQEICDNYQELFKFILQNGYINFKNFSYVIVLLALIANKNLCNVIGNDNVNMFKKAALSNWNFILMMDSLLEEFAKDETINKKELSSNLSSGEWYTWKSTNEFELKFRDLSKNDLKEFREGFDKKEMYRFSLDEHKKTERIPANQFQEGDYFCFEEAYKLVVYENLKQYTGKTASFLELEPKGKKFMIIDLGRESQIRIDGKDFSASDIKGDFIVTDGIEYKSKSDTDTLVYMEV